MKKRLVTVYIFLYLLLNCNVIGWTQTHIANNSNYVIIGAFSVQNNASRFVKSAKQQDLNAEYTFNPDRELYYVFVLRTKDVTQAMAQAAKLRMETSFNGTWVYKGLLGEKSIEQNVLESSSVAEQKIVVVKEDVQPKVEEVIPVISDDNSVKEVPQNDVALEKDNVIVKAGDSEPGSKGFIFKIASSNGEELNGDIELIDADRIMKVASYEGNKQVFIKPVNKTGKILLICNFFGYRKVQKVLNYNLPDTTSGVVMENNNAVVPFELIKLQKGDISVMYNVFFFKDASIMRQDSRYEVMTLKNMMIENQKFIIKLHGHTNGNAAGKIIKMGDTKNFFSISGSKDGFGTAKELSESRAGVIREFLISEGIDGNRILVKGWGGKKALHDKGSNKAQENVRVEVEIVEDK